MTDTTDTTNVTRRSLAGLALGAVAATPAVAQMRGGRMALGNPTAGNWMQQVQAQHRAVDMLFIRLKQTRDNQVPMRTMLLKQLADSLTAHSIAEEVVLYPAIAQKNMVPKSDELYLEQAHAKVILNELDKIPKQGPEFLTRLVALETAIKEHVADEEGNTYPRLMAASTAAENAKMSADFRLHFTKYIA